MTFARKMRFIETSLTVVVCASWCLFNAHGDDRSLGVTSNQISQIREDMSVEEVLAILGPPLRNHDTNGFIGEWAMRNETNSFCFFIGKNTRIPHDTDLLYLPNNLVKITEGMTDQEILATVDLGDFIPYLMFTASSVVFTHGQNVEKTYLGKRFGYELKIKRYAGRLLHVTLVNMMNGEKTVKEFPSESRRHLSTDNDHDNALPKQINDANQASQSIGAQGAPQTER